MVTIRIPAPSSLLVSNLLGVVGILAIIAAVGVLTAWPWALLTGGLFALTLAVLAQTGERADVTSIERAPSHRRGKAA